MIKPFKFPWGEKTGTILTIDTGTGLCDYTSEVCANMLRDSGYTEVMVETIFVPSPIDKDIIIRHKVAIGRKNNIKYILDQPQKEFLTSGHEGAWEPVFAIMSNNVHPNFQLFKDLHIGLGYSIEWILVNSNRISNLTKTNEKYPTYRALFDNTIQIEYDSDSEDLRFYNESTTRFIQDEFVPRLIVIKENETTQDAYIKELNK